MDKDEFKYGDEVNHPYLGKGIVIQVLRSAFVDVLFESGIKAVSTEHLQKILKG